MKLVRKAGSGKEYLYSQDAIFSLTATRRGTTIRTHNLRYANGIAHVLNDYTRNVAF